MSNFRPYGSDMQMSDRQITAMREARRSQEKNTMKTRSRIEEVQERLRRERELDYAQ